MEDEQDNDCCYTESGWVSKTSLLALTKFEKTTALKTNSLGLITLEVFMITFEYILNTFTLEYFTTRTTREKHSLYFHIW